MKSTVAKEVFPVTSRFSRLFEDTVNDSKDKLVVTSRSPSTVVPVPELPQVKSTVTAARSALVSISSADAVAPVTVRVVKSLLLSTWIAPDTSAEIVADIRLLFVERVTEDAIPAILTVSRSPKEDKEIAGPNLVAAVVASGSTTPVTSIVSTLVRASTVKETN